MILVLGSAAMASLGIALLVVALAPRRQSLAAELAHVIPSASATDPTATTFWVTFGDAIWSTLGLDRNNFPGLVKDLATMDESVAVLARRIVTTSAVFAALAGTMFTVLATEGVRVGGVFELTVVALAAAIGAAAPRAILRVQAADRRGEMREVVAVICDLAAVLVAAGEDTDGALLAAAGAGTGWAFESVRASLPVTGRMGPWVSLERLGDTLGVDELVSLARNMGLAVEKGAKVREALNTQARTLREVAASEAEAKAGSMTERMSVPMVMFLAGFLLVIGYPAAARL